MKTKKLIDPAKTIRSKNAGTDKITFDILSREKENYELVKKSGVLTRQSVAKLFNIPDESISGFMEFDPAYAIKFTIRRREPSGSPGDSDIFGAQHCPPLPGIEVPVWFSKGAARRTCSFAGRCGRAFKQMNLREKNQRGKILFHPFPSECCSRWFSG